MKKYFFPVIMITFIFFTACKKEDQQVENEKPRYIFYFIGDGMGINQIHLSEIYMNAIKDGDSDYKVSFHDFPVNGWISTRSQDKYITGSAAAGTAMATGYKTKSKTIGMDSVHQIEYESVATYLKKKGMKTGIISSVSINHATPAVFYAHVKHREHYYEIGKQLFESNFDFFGGGSFKEPQGENKEDESLFEIAKNYDYQFVYDKAGIMELSDTSLKYIVSSKFLDADQALLYAMDTNDNYISLADITSKAIELLDNEKGFFMMVEGGKIDWACHNNDVAAMIYDLIAFDEAILAALNFYEKHKENTLIIVSADHETGGLTLGNDDNAYDAYPELIQYRKKSLDNLRTQMLDEKIGRNPEKIWAVLNEAFGFDKHERLQLSKKEKDDLDALIKSISSGKNKSIEPKPLLYEANRLFNKKSGIGWTTFHHSGGPIPVFAIGAGAENFAGWYENNVLAKKLFELFAE
jgi:alkaline phosphatase